MKRALCIILTLLISWQGMGMSNDNREGLLFSTENFISKWDSQSTKFQKLNTKLASDYKKFGKSQKFLKMLFYRSQKYLLGSYSQYASIDELIQNGVYDCVSGSLLLSVFLEEYGFDYDIIETSYHVFVQVNLEEKKLILESTDSFDGFIYRSEDVNAYLKDFEGIPPGTDFYLEPAHKMVADILEPVVFKEIGIQELKGLEYFNKAIFHNNKGELTVAIDFINQAEQFYASKRIKALGNLLKAQKTLARMDK